MVLAAAHAFNETGFYATTLDDIAARLHISKPTLYYYVKSKDDILLECYRRGFAHMQHAIERTREPAWTGLQRMEAFLLAYMELVTSPFGKCIAKTGLQPLTPQSRAKIAPITRQINDAFQEILRQGFADKSIRQTDPKLTTNAMLGCFNSVVFWYEENGKLDSAQLAAYFIDLFFVGIQPQRIRTGGDA